jgi:hypothetical protein
MAAQITYGPEVFGGGSWRSSTCVFTPGTPNIPPEVAGQTPSPRRGGHTHFTKRPKHGNKVNFSRFIHNVPFLIQSIVQREFRRTKRHLSVSELGGRGFRTAPLPSPVNGLLTTFAVSH